MNPFTTFVMLAIIVGAAFALTELLWAVVALVDKDRRHRAARRNHPRPAKHILILALILVLMLGLLHERTFAQVIELLQRLATR